MKFSKASVLSPLRNIKFFNQINSSDANQNFSLIKYFWGPDKPLISTQHPNLKICEADQRFSIAYSFRQMELYSLCEQSYNNNNASFCSCQTIVFDEAIQFVCSTSRVNSPVILVLVQLQSEIRLYKIDEKNKKLIFRSNFWIGDIHSISFFNSNTILAVANHNQLWQFEYLGQKLSKKSMLLFKTHNEVQHGKFIKGFIMSGFEQTKEQHKIFFFYITFKMIASNIQEGRIPVETLMIKQFQKRRDKIQQQQLYVMNTKQAKKYIEISKGNIFKLNNSFVLVLEEEIIIIQKIFEQYTMVDNIRKKTQQSSMLCCQDGTFCFCSKDMIQVCKINITQMRCEVQNINVFQRPQFSDFKLFKIQDIGSNYWFYFYHQNTKNKGNMKLANLVKQDAMKKLINLSKLGINSKIFWQLSFKLDISKKQFFLQQWQKSEKSFADINNFLFQTQDISLIKYELKISYHKNSFPTVELITIYSKLLKLIQMKLTQELSIKLIKQYLKCHFLVRKLKIQSTRKIGYQEFIKLTKKGIIQHLQELYQQYKQISGMSSRQRQKDERAGKTEIIIKNILTEYHILLIQNYEVFLLQLIKQFTLQLSEFLTKFSFFLPNYPYQFMFIHKDQVNMIQNQHPNKLFNPITQFQWQQQLSINKLKNFLQKHHLTSTVQQRIAQLKSNSRFLKKCLINHGLILSSKDEFLFKAKKIAGISLYLKICEFNNIESLKRNGDYSSLSLIEIFKKSNFLIGSALNTCYFYSQLHWILNKNQIKLSIAQIQQMKDQDIVSLFFLGDKQRVYLVLKDLKNLYDKYRDSDRDKCRDQFTQKSQFNQTQMQNILSSFNLSLNKFVISDFCSPIQVIQLLEQINQNGRQFQDQNQELINTVIDGYCCRTQIRQDRKINDMIEKLKDIYMAMFLNRRIQKIEIIISKKQLFQTFSCEKLFIIDIENQGNIILNLFMENFFTGKITKSQLNLDGQIVTLNSVRNMLNILLYLQQHIYYDNHNLTQQNILLIYGIKLIQYQCFEEIKSLMEEEQLFAQLKIQSRKYFQNLITYSLNTIYTQSKDCQFNQIRDHVEKVLQLYQNGQLIKNHFARFRVGTIIQEIGIEITTFQLCNIDNNQQFLAQIIQGVYENITFQQIQDLYNYLEIMKGKQERQVDNSILTLITLFAKTLVHNKSTKKMQIKQSLLFLLRYECFDQLQGLFTEAMLQSISKLYPQQCSTSKKIIQHYVQKFGNIEQMTIMFDSWFSIECLNTYQKQQSLNISQKYFYYYLSKYSFKFDEIYSLAQKRGKNISQIYRYYYFLLCIIQKPNVGFKLFEIDIRCQQIQQLVKQFEQLMKRLQRQQQKSESPRYSIHKKDGNNFNPYQLKKYFFIGLCQLGCNIVNLKEIDLLYFNNFSTDLQFIELFQHLKEQNQTKLLKMIKKYFNYLQINENNNKDRIITSEKYIQQLKQMPNKIIKQKNKQKQEKRRANSSKSLHKTITYRMYEDYKNLSYAHPLKQQNQIIDMVEGSKTDRNIYNRSQSVKILPMKVLDESHIENNKSQNLSIFQKQDVNEILRKYPCQQKLKSALRQYYIHSQISNFVSILQKLKVGEQHNIKTIQSAIKKKFKFQLKQLFSFDFFFFKANQDSSNELVYLNSIFDYLSPKIKDMINQQNWTYSKFFYEYFGRISVFQFKVIIFAIQKALSSNYIPRLSDIIHPMLQKLSVQIISDNFDDLLTYCKNKQSKIAFLSLLDSKFQNSLTFSQFKNQNKVNKIFQQIKGLLEEQEAK